MYKKITMLAVLLTHGAIMGDDVSLRVMTYNIRREGPEKQEDRLWKNRTASVILLWRSVNPTIVGLQEVTDSQMQDVQSSFKEFTFVGTKGRGSSWFGLATDEATPIGYKTDTFELQEHGTFPINEVNTWYGWMPWHVYQTGFLPRICTWAKLKDTQKDKEFYVYNTHLDHMYDEARVLGARTIMQDITERTAGLPVILTGDLNTPVEGEIKEVLSDLRHAKDAVTPAGPCETSTGWDNNDLKEIDHILVNKMINKITSYRVVTAEGFPSDHRPVVADITL